MEWDNLDIATSAGKAKGGAAFGGEEVIRLGKDRLTGEIHSGG